MYSVTGHKLRQRAIRRRAMTLIEMVMAMGLLSIVFAVLMPQFRILQRSWGLKEASAESLQNGRVLLDHMQTHLAAAAAITDISDASESMGFIEYWDADGVLMRYETGADNWVFFGPAGSVSALAGPVSTFQISGYAADDLGTAISDPSAMCLLRIESTFPDPRGVGRDRELAAFVFLRAGAMP